MEQHAILVAIDLPLDSTRLEPLIDLAQGANWKLHLLHVAPPNSSTEGPDASKVEDVASELRDEGLDAIALTVSGPTVEVITDSARYCNAKMIVVVGQNHHLAHRTFLSSVTSSLLKVSALPVLVLPPPVKEVVIPADGLGTATDRLIEILERTKTDGEFEDLRVAVKAQQEDPQSEERRRTLADRIQDSVESFEENHPGLARAIGDVSYYLSGSGI